MLFCVESSKLLITSFPSLFFAFIYMNCTGKMVRIARGRLGILSMVKLKKKSLSRGSFRTHGWVIRNKNFFIFGLTLHFYILPEEFNRDIYENMTVYYITKHNVF